MVCTFSHLPCMQPRQGEGRSQSHWAGLGFHTETWPCPTWYRSLEKKWRVVPFPRQHRAEDSTRLPGGPVGLASARAFTHEAASSRPAWTTWPRGTTGPLQASCKAADVFLPSTLAHMSPEAGAVGGHQAGDRRAPPTMATTEASESGGCLANVCG